MSSIESSVGRSSFGVDEDALTDDELVTAMRGGDDHAYEILWKRHVGVARRVAARLVPSQADDLVSESFLAVYDQIRTRGKGPTESFRPYLFAVMRNTSARWYREGSRIAYEPEVDGVVEHDGLQRMEQEYDATVVLTAFRALPERWQRVLWLVDVDDAKRPAIAAELGIRPNAVSVLYRRARTGLRTRWLLEQVPAELRADRAHAAASLPAYIVSGTASDAVGLKRHLHQCEHCRAVDRELRSAYRDERKAGRSVGPLAALGVVIPTASALWTAAAPPTAVAALGLTGSAAVLAGVLALGVGVGVLTPALLPRSGASPVIPVSSSGPVDDNRTVGATAPRTPLPVPPAEPQIPRTGPTIRPVDESTVPTIDVLADDGTGQMPDRPAPRPPETPGTVITPVGGEAGAPVVVTTVQSASYLAPMLAGAAPAGTDVALRVGSDIYRTQPTDAGQWTFDLRSLLLPAGNYTASVWTITAGVASAATAVPFTVRPLGIAGFSEYEPITLRAAMDGGLQFTVTGPPGGTVCLDSDNGQSAVIPLNAETGTAVRRLRFFAYGLYVLRLTACDGDSFGPDLPRTVSVVEGVFDPWDVGEEPYWEIDDPTAP
ncbi:sigma-70 family RNA polymerase sigma factor [Plantibacter sp. Mn2098]|uniref:RNA polymerase sigma factor n=1 Tax=Plantibacter sp. Mn2098 TaxID=3395266 RepID=UPI003BD1DE39